MATQWRISYFFFAVLFFSMVAFFMSAEIGNSIISLRSTDSSSVGASSGVIFKGDPKFNFPMEQARFKGFIATSQNQEKFSANLTCTKWSVVTTIFDPSPAILRQTSLGSDWCTVVIGDKKSPPHFRVEGQNVFYLESAAQTALSGAMRAFVKILPWNNFGRKNIGYLYAIQRGAKTIWDFDDDNLLVFPEKLDIIDKGAVEYKLPLSHSFPSYNPYVVFGASGRPTWPRGFPLAHIKNEESWTSELSAVKLEGDRIGVIQSLANGDPDVDAIYRLLMPLPFSFTNAALQDALLVIPPRALTPMNAQAALFKQPAFWTLLLPISVNGRVSDIWRSYVGQRLMWDIGLYSAFSSPLVEQQRNPHNYMADFNSEIPLYEKSERLVDFLRDWKGEAPTLQGRMEELYIELYTRDYIGIGDVHLLQSWIETLDAIGYSFPPLKNNVTEFSELSTIQTSVKSASRSFVWKAWLSY